MDSGFFDAFDAVDFGEQLTVLVNAMESNHAMTYQLSLNEEMNQIEVKLFDKPVLGQELIRPNEIDGIKIELNYAKRD